jgi:hypothetical protein
MSGTIPASFSKLTPRLNVLQLAHNKLTGVRLTYPYAVIPYPYPLSTAHQGAMALALETGSRPTRFTQTWMLVRSPCFVPW